MTPADIAEKLAAIHQAGSLLRRRPRAERIDALGRVFELWSNPDSKWRRALLESLPEATGFTPPNVERGLAAGFDHWNAAAWLELVRSELGADYASDDPTRAVSGFESTAVVLAGSIPMPTLLSLVTPLALGSPVIAKSTSRDPVTPNLVADSIAEVDAGLGRCIEIVDLSSDDEAAMRAMLDASCICATGSDGTIAALQARVRPPRRMVFDGHRLSVAAIGDRLGTDQIVETARCLALDISLWDQLGCLSPVVVYAVDRGSPSAENLADRLADALVAALESAEREWPRGAIEPVGARDVVRERSEAELRSAAGHAVRVCASDSTAWTVVRESGPELRPAPLHRFVRVLPVVDTNALADALVPMASHLAAVAVDGFGPETGAVCHRLAALGASRVCRPGTMQSPPLGWHHAGRGVLSSQARISDIEC